METTPNTSGGLRMSVRLYQALLAVYPAEFRQAYGGPMLQVFGDCCRRAFVEAGTAGLLILWWRTLLDTIQTAIEEHLQRGTYMSKSKFIKLSGWALFLSGILVLLGSVAGSRPQYSQYNALSLPIDRYANAAMVPILAMGFLLLIIGTIGLYLRYGQKAGSFGRYSLIAGAIGGVVGTVGFILLAANGLWESNNEGLWLLFTAGITIQFLGLVFFGIASLKQCTLPRWNWLPIVAGLWIPAYFISGVISEVLSGTWKELPSSAITIMIVITMIGLAGLGYLLVSDSQPAELSGLAA